MMQKLEVLDEARNSTAMLKARLMADYATERDLMSIIQDHDKFVLAQNALMVNLCQFIDQHCKALFDLGIKAWNSADIVEFLMHRMAELDNCELDIDTREVE
jgi:hypothetical protein